MKKIFFFIAALAVAFTANANTVSSENEGATATEGTAVYKDITVTVYTPWSHQNTPKIYWWGALGLEDVTLENAQEMIYSDSMWDSYYTYTFQNVDSITGVNFVIVSDGVHTKSLIAHADTTIQFYEQLQPVQIAVVGVDEAYTLESDDECLNALVVIPLEAEAEKEFKLVVDGHDKGNSTIAITKENKTALFADDAEGNAKITTDLKGGYIFTYSYVTKELTVTYPCAHTLDMGECAAQRGFEGIVIADAGYNNSVTTYNLNDEGEYIYGDELPVRATLTHEDSYVIVSGVCSWNEVDGKLVLIANNLTDENGTVTYTITATCPLPQEYTLNLTGTYLATENDDEKKVVYIATTEDGDKLTITSSIASWGDEVSGQMGENYLSSVEDLVVVDGENDTITVTCVAYDYAGNTYNITIVATPYVAPELVFTNVKFELTYSEYFEKDILRGYTEYNGDSIVFSALEYDPASTECENTSIYETNWSWEWYATGAVTITKVGDVYTVKGSFINYMTNETYNVTLTSAAELPSALDNIQSIVTPMKVIENGQLIIIKNGVKYNLQGAIVK